MPEEITEVCTKCDHPFHAGKCFNTNTISGHYLRCTCKKGVKA